MRILNPEDYSAAARKLCAYSFTIIILYPFFGLLSVGLQEATNKGFIVIPVKVLDTLITYLPFPVSVLGVIAALLAVWNGHSRKKALIGGLGNVAAFTLWFFINWILHTR